MRVVSWTSLALSDDAAHPAPIERFCAGCAGALYLAACAAAAHAVLRALAPPRCCLRALRCFSHHPRTRTALSWGLALLPSALLAAHSLACTRTPASHALSTLAAVALATAAVEVAAFSLAATFCWPVASEHAHSRLHWRQCVQPGLLLTAAATLLACLGTALAWTHAPHAPSLHAVALLMWLAELAPTGAALLCALHTRDPRAHTPLPVGTHDDPDDWHIVQDDPSAASLGVTPTTSPAVVRAGSSGMDGEDAAQPPRAPSAGLEQAGTHTVAVPEYRVRIVAGAAPARAVIVLVRASNFADAYDTEIDRTEVLGNDGRDAAPLAFCKTLLVPDRELDPARAPPLVALFSLRDPAAPVCVACQRLAPATLSGAPLALVSPETLFAEESLSDHSSTSTTTTTTTTSSTNGTRRGPRRISSVRISSGDLAARLLDSSMLVEGADEPPRRGTPGAGASAEGLAVVLERQGRVAVHPKSTQLGCCVRTFQFFGQIDGPAVRIGVRQELWPSANAFELPRQVLQRLLPRRRIQLTAAQRDLQHLLHLFHQNQEEDEGWNEGEEREEEEMDALRTAEERAAFTGLVRQCEAAVGAFAAHVGAMARAVDAYSAAQLRWAFKPSVRKFDRALCFVPTNLHTEVMTVRTTKKTAPAVRVRPPAAYAFVTLGVPAALVYRAPPNGARDLRERVATLRANSAPEAAQG